MGRLPFRGEVSPGLCNSFTSQTASGTRRPAKSTGLVRRRRLQLAREPGAAEAASRLPRGWTSAPWAAAERSARNLLTGPEQRAANPAGGRGRAGGRRDPAPSPRRRRVHRAFLIRADGGQGRGPQGRTRRPPPRRPRAPLPSAQVDGGALLLIASSPGSGSHWFRRHRPAAAHVSRSPPGPRSASSPGPRPPSTWATGGVILGTGIGSSNAGNDKVALLPACSWHLFWGGRGEGTQGAGKTQTWENQQHLNSIWSSPQLGEGRV